MQICFIDVSTLNVEGKDSEVCIFCSPPSWNGWETAERVVSDSIVKGKGCGRGWKGGGDSGGSLLFL